MSDRQTNLPARRRLRLPWFDYSSHGTYFITVCTHAKQPLLGVVREARMVENPVGCAVRTTWDHLPTRFPEVELDAFVVMPNHVHGIVVLRRDSPIRLGSGTKSGSPTLGEVVGAFKSLSARAANRELKRQGPVWQRGYYEHIVRDEDDLNRIRRYIDTNPLFWEKDQERVPDNVALRAGQAPPLRNSR